MLRRFTSRITTPMMARSAVTLPSGLGYVEPRIKDAADGGAYEAMEKFQLTITRHDEVLVRQADVKHVQIVTTSGELGVSAGHEYKISKLLPGLINVELPDGSFKKYFSAGGFAHINNAGSVDINCPECIPLDDLDLALAQKALTDTQAKKDAAGNSETMKVVYEVQVDVLESVISALKGGSHQ